MQFRETMQFREGTDVVTSDGEKVGDIERLVVDPSTREVTHLVVSKGFLLPEDRVVPVATVVHAGEEKVVLSPGIDIDDLPPFEKAHYLDVKPGSISTSWGALRAPLVWGYPTAGPSTGPIYPAYPVHPTATPGALKTVERNVPDGSRVVETGTEVVAADGDKVGKVKAVVTDDHGVMSAFHVDPGWFRDEQTIPAHWVERVGEDQVVLALDTATLEQLGR